MYIVIDISMNSMPSIQQKCAFLRIFFFYLFICSQWVHLVFDDLVVHAREIFRSWFYLLPYLQAFAPLVTLNSFIQQTPNYKELLPKFPSIAAGLLASLPPNTFGSLQFSPFGFIMVSRRWEFTTVVHSCMIYHDDSISSSSSSWYSYIHHTVNTCIITHCCWQYSAFTWKSIPCNYLLSVNVYNASCLFIDCQFSN